MSILENLNKEDFEAALQPYVNERVSFDAFKVAAIIELVEAVHGPSKNLRTGIYELNGILETMRKLHGQMCSRPRKPRVTRNELELAMRTKAAILNAQQREKSL